MRIRVDTGTYVVAVSGGVDSMVLLDLLRQNTKLKLVIAHFDHGIRSDSHKDRKLVQNIALAHKLPFVYEEAKLGPGVSEARARAERYKFLEKVRRASTAKAIITAHHQDDVLETVIFNLIRGTGRRGLTSLKSTDDIVRPLLAYDKERLREYANTHMIAWREDPTNRDTTYTRNYIRANILSKFSEAKRAQLLILLDQLSALNQELDAHLEGLLHIQPALNELSRGWFIGLPHDIAKEVAHVWLRRQGVKNITRKTIDRMVTAMKIGRNGQSIDVDKKFRLNIKRDVLALIEKP